LESLSYIFVRLSESFLNFGQERLQQPSIDL
jgi:hypothetical protein